MTLNRDVLAAIRAHGRETYPNECCGALIGARRRGRRSVRRCRTRPKRARDDGFSCARRTIAAPKSRATESGRELLGFYHSHPDHPAQPSQYDLDHAWPFFSYVIVSVREGEPRELRSWRLRDDRSTFDEEEVAMPIKVHIPTPLRPFTDKLDVVELDGTTIGELMSNLTTKFGGLKQHLFNDEGRLRSFVNVYVNDEDIRYLQKDQTPLKAGDTVSIIPSVAGGARRRPRLRRRRSRAGGPAGAVGRRDPPLQPSPDPAGSRHGRAAQR